jgi:hypothetical protein
VLCNNSISLTSDLRSSYYSNAKTLATQPPDQIDKNMNRNKRTFRFYRTRSGQFASRTHTGCAEDVRRCGELGFEKESRFINKLQRGKQRKVLQVV